MNEKESNIIGELNVIAKVSSCGRRQIAAAICDSNMDVIAVGVNGVPSVCECTCEGRNVPAGAGAKMKVSCDGIHAEIAALIKCGSRIEDARYVISTKAPCTNCAAILIHGTKIHTAIFEIDSIETANSELWKRYGGKWVKI